MGVRRAVLLGAVAVAMAAPAWNGTPAAKAAPAADVSLDGPSDVLVDGGTVYVVDQRHKAIRRLDLATRRLTAVPTSEPLIGPFKIAMGSDRALIAIDLFRVVRISLDDGRVTTLAGERRLEAEGRRVGALEAIAADPRGGGAFVAGLDSIVRIDGAGRVSHVAGGTGLTGYDPGATSGDGGPAASAGFAFVSDLLADPSGNLYVAQFSDFPGGDRVRRIDAATGVVTTVIGPETAIAGRDGAEADDLADPQHLAWDASGGLVVAERGRILRADLASGGVRVISDRQPSYGSWSGLAIAPDGALIVTDYTLNRVRRIDPRTDRIRSIAGRGPRIHAIEM